MRARGWRRARGAALVLPLLVAAATLPTASGGPPSCIAPQFKCMGCADDIALLCDGGLDTALCSDLELAGIGRFTARACGGIDPYAYSGPPLPPPDDAGGWSTLPSSFESDECSIDIVDGSGLSAEAFEATYRGKQPVVLRNLTRALGWKAHFAWRRPDLLAGFGDRMLIADTTHRSQGRGAEKTPGQAATLAEHIASFAAQHEALSRGELSSEPELERRYAFDRAFISERAPELLGHFSTPPQVRLKTVDHVRVPNPRS